MRQETNNEIDLLLRRLSRGQGSSAPNGDLRTDHLDADELSAYAENALPATPRSRYTEHLAECSRCRELVVQLSSSAGVVVAEETAPVSGPSGLRKFLANLFSPMVLRYAVPALGLIVVAAIALVVFRRGEPGFVALNAPQPSEGHTAQREAPLSAPLDQPQVAQTQERRDSSATTPQAPGANKVRGAQTAEPPSVGSPTGAAAPAEAEATAGKKKLDQAEPPPPPKTEQQQVAAAAPQPTSVKAPETTDDFRKTEPKERDQNVRGRAVINEAEKQNKFEIGQRSEDKAANRPAKSRSMVFGGAPSVGAVSSKRKDAEEKDRDDAEMRTVAGRRFRKQGGVWVDTAYQDGATIDLARGSEQYRALIADEPAIKTIAEELDGQIIVVWKTRTYKIR